VTAVLDVPVIVDVNGYVSDVPIVAVAGDTERVIPEDKVTVAVPVTEVSAAETAVIVTVHGAVGVGVQPEG
jgi:hypothetical protein